MPYEIETKDGLVLRGIPDHIKPDSPEVKARVARERRAAGMIVPGGATLDNRMGSGPRTGSSYDYEKLQNNPALGMSGAERLVAGYGGAIPQMVRGIGQRLNLVSQQEADERAKLEKPLLETTEGAVGRAFGIGVPLAATGIIPAANTLLGSGAVGAAAGLMEPTPTGENAAGNAFRGGLAGTFGAGVARVLPTVAKSMIDPFRAKGREQITGKALLSAAGTNADNVIAAAKNPAMMVKGSVPNMAEATQDAGIAGFQLSASSLSPEVKRQLAEQGGLNAGARVEALRGLSGTPAQRENAEQVRSWMADLLYKKARTQGIDQEMAAAIKPQIDNLLERMPRGVIEQAKELARMKGEAFTETGSVNGLHYIKLAIDDLLSKTGESGVGKQTRAGLAQFKGDLLKTIEQISPAYGAAKTVYEGASRPINQMQVGEYLTNKLQPALMDYAQGVPTRSSAQSYAQALRDAPTTVKRSTGMGGFKELSDVMTPEGVMTAENVARDLARSATAQDLAKTTGSTTAQNLAGQNLIRQFMGPTGLPQSWGERLASSSLAAPLTKGANLIYSGAESRIQEVMARALRDPEYAAKIMEGARSPLISNQKLAQALLTLRQGAALSPVAMMGAE